MSRISHDVARLMENSRQRVGITRRPLLRIYEIHAAILQGNYPNCSTLAQKLSVERKTIQRDISFMRDELGLPLVYDDALHGYRYDRDVSDFPVFQTTAEELAGLFLARQALESVRGTALATTLREAFAKLTRGMLDQSSLGVRSMRRFPARSSNRIHATSNASEKLRNPFSSSELRPFITENWMRKKASYDGSIHCTWAKWMAAGISSPMTWSAPPCGPSRFPRMTRLKVLNDRFEKLLGFEGREYLKQSFGIWNVAGDQTRQVVRVELRDYAARLAQERRWHPTQELAMKNTKGTRVVVRFEVGRLEEVMRWVLSFGSHAKVLGPPELQRMVRDEIRAMAGE
jgi:predicted DNA-binding transcriptional regulator YafY